MIEAAAKASIPLAGAPLPAPNLRAPPRWLVATVLQLRRALLKMADAVVPPQLPLLERIVGAGFTVVIGEMARLGIADLLADGPKTAEELAAATGTNVDALRRTLRGGVSIGLFQLGSGGRFENARLAGGLRRGEGSLRDFARYFASESNVRAWLDYPRVLATGTSGFERVHGKSVWEWFDQHPAERDAFAAGMASGTRYEAPSIAKAFPFNEVKRLCDVGGGSGTLLGHVLLEWPHLEGVLLDGPGVLAQARDRFAAYGVAGRAQLVPGSFFDSVPPGCDAYMMKNILHDWDDARSLKILGNVRGAMQPGQRLLICEGLIEDPHTDGVTLADLQMMVVCSDGRERTRAEYAALLEKSGFQPGRVLSTAFPTTWVIEGLAV